MVYDRHSCDLVLVGSANEAYRLNLEQVLPCLCNNGKPENLNDVISSLGGSFCLLPGFASGLQGGRVLAY